LTLLQYFQVGKRQPCYEAELLARNLAELTGLPLQDESTKLGQ
jgi:hypothetical protein